MRLNISIKPTIKILKNLIKKPITKILIKNKISVYFLIASTLFPDLSKKSLTLFNINERKNKFLSSFSKILKLVLSTNSL